MDINEMADSGYDFYEFDTSTDIQQVIRRESLINDFFNLLSQIVEKMQNLLKDLKNFVFSPKKQHSDENNGEKKNIRKDDTQNLILKEVLTKPVVNNLDDLAGMQSIKKALFSLVILPRRQPQLFAKRALNSILLFGPPGTGKTRLVHALAAHAEARLYSISLGDIISSFIGQTERNIQNLFQSLINSEEFSILFIDELDGICRKRSSSEQEYSRRIKTQLMCQLTNASEAKNLIIMAATNTPWELDTAILRRFQKRLYIPLPNKNDRLQLFQLFTETIPIVNNENLESLIEISEGFSGSDISTLVNDALDIPITELQDNKIWMRRADGFYEPYSQDFEIDSVEMKDILVQDISHFAPCTIKARTVTTLDFLKAAENIRPTVSEEEGRKFEEFIGKLKCD